MKTCEICGKQALPFAAPWLVVWDSSDQPHYSCCQAHFDEIENRLHQESDFQELEEMHGEDAPE